MLDIIAESFDDEEINSETQALLDFLTYAEDEGFIEMEEGEDGEVRLWPSEL